MVKTQASLALSVSGTNARFINKRQQLAHILWREAVSFCHGTKATYDALKGLDDTSHYAILSIGKAAVSMTLGAHQALGQDIPSLTITKENHIDSDLTALTQTYPHIDACESSHPMPDESSLLAGQMALDFVEGLSTDSCLIMLISGGASALCELLVEGVSLRELQKLTQQHLSSGATIEEINAARSEISIIKQGKILKNFRGREVQAYLISDVAGEDMATIASGIALYPEGIPPEQFKHSISLLRTNNDARNAVSSLAKNLGLKVQKNCENLYGNVTDCAPLLGHIIKTGEAGVYIFGGEPTVHLPQNPGEGGRAQYLSLALAKELQGAENITCLVAGTDGTDGPTQAAGGLVEAHTFSPQEEAETALIKANAGAFLRQKNSLYITGSTGTNVMDIAVCLKLTEEQASQAIDTFKS